MTDLRQAAQQALQYLESNADADSDWEIMIALRKALEQPEQEPVAEITVKNGHWIDTTGFADQTLPDGLHKLYTTPPAVQRQWVGLDEDDIRKLYGKDLNYRDGNYVRYAMAVEAKLKEKNGY